MPGRPHHTDKMKRCVEEVKAKGHNDSSAYAICTTSLQNAGESIYEDRAAEAHGEHTGEIRDLHLCGATGTVRYEMLNGRKHMVVPIVALMEGVIHPVNAETPEFVPLETLKAAAASWVGKPVMLGHPKRGGKQCSADDPEIRKSVGLGVIMSSKVEGKKMLQEAWIDDERAKALHPAMHERLASGKREEVSVGTFVIAEPKDDVFNGKRYKFVWKAAEGDHLAFLPGGRGACSNEMGCGTHRAAMHFVAAESIERLPELPIQVFTALDGESLDERINKINQAVYEQYSPKGGSVAPTMGAYPIQVYDDRVIVRKADGSTCSIDYKIENGEVVFGKVTEVKQQWVEAGAKAATKECAMCMGLGVLGGNPCPACDGEGMVKTLAGARHSSADMKMIQTMHDHSVALGAQCEPKAAEEKVDINILIDGKVIARALAGQVLTTVPILHEKRPVIKREGTQWILYSKDGARRLASHSSEADAIEQADAIERVLAKKCG